MNRITGKRKYFINRARAGKSAEDKQEEELVGAEEQLEALSVDDYQSILQQLKINLPRGALNAEVSDRSTHPDVIRDSRAIVQDLRNATLTVAANPRLACVKVKQAYNQKEKGKITEFTRLLFFKKRKTSEKTLKNRWEEHAPESGCRFRMRDTFNETPISVPEPSVRPTGGGRTCFGNPEENQKNAEDCFEFFLKQKGHKPEEVRFRKEYKAESGFIFGRMDFLLDSAESSDASPREKIIVECKGTKGDMVGDVFTLPDEGHRAEFNKSHKYYYQTQAYLYVLKKEVSPVPVRAVMVVKHTAEGTNPKFYWGEVSNDTENIQKLDQFCQEEALPCFLSVLNLIFQKVEERESAGEMEREEKEERESAGEMEREEKEERESAGEMESISSS